jgi:hypothetical protein
MKNFVSCIPRRCLAAQIERRRRIWLLPLQAARDRPLCAAAFFLSICFPPWVDNIAHFNLLAQVFLLCHVDEDFEKQHALNVCLFFSRAKQGAQSGQ